MYLSKSKDKARVESPLERIGFRHAIKPKTPKADESSTKLQLEKILKIRESDTGISLRREYRKLIKYFESKPSELEFPEFSELNNLWEKVTYQYNNDLRLSDSLDKWTDYITIPAFLVGFAFPFASAIPLVTWGASKLNRLHAKDCLKNKHPWYFVSEQVKNLEREVIVEAISQGKGKRDKY